MNSRTGRIAEKEASEQPEILSLSSSKIASRSQLSRARFPYFWTLLDSLLRFVYRL